MDICYEIAGWIMRVLSLGGLILLIWLIIRVIKRIRSGRCLNCGGDIKGSNLFCPWCHCDLRGGGKG
ncbi:MAG: hypothetical protein Q8L57_03030 [bacterium]|nr:hypothetical protein [bacterium]